MARLAYRAEGKRKTAIPEGEYPVRLAWSPRFKRKMPCLQDVPGFTGVLIHPGNSVADTQGCILVGERQADGRLKNSRMTFDRLYDLLERAENISIRII